MKRLTSIALAIVATMSAAPATALTLQEVRETCTPQAEAVNGSPDEQERAYSRCVGTNYFAAMRQECRERETPSGRDTPVQEILAKGERMKQCEREFRQLPKTFAEKREATRQAKLVAEAPGLCKERQGRISPRVPQAERDKWYNECVQDRSNGINPPELPVAKVEDEKSKNLQKPKCKNVTFSGPLLAAGNPMGLAMNAAILNDPEAFVNHKRHQPLQCTPKFCFGAGLADGKGIARFEDIEKGITVISGVLIDDAGRTHEAEVAIKSTFVRCGAPT